MNTVYISFPAIRKPKYKRVPGAGGDPARGGEGGRDRDDGRQQFRRRHHRRQRPLRHGREAEGSREAVAGGDRGHQEAHAQEGILTEHPQEVRILEK